MELTSLPAAATAACALLATLFLLLLLRRSPIRRRLPPGPRPWPVVGNLYQLEPVLFRRYAEWAARYGPVMSVWLGSTLNVVVSSPELAKEVLREKDQHLADRHRSRSVARFSRDGQDLIWADYGPHYVKVRKVCTLELFSPRRLEALRPIREDEVTAMVESIYRDCTDPEKKGKGLAVRSYLSAASFNNISRLVFGKRFVGADGAMHAQGMEFKGIIADGFKLVASLAMAEHIPWLRALFPLEEEAFARHGARHDRFTDAILEEHRRLRRESGGAAKQHFVDALHTLQKQYDLGDDTVNGLLWDMISAGMDTTAIAAEWAMAELIRHPRVQAEAQAELDRVVGPGRVMTEADLPRLPYLQCVAKEALRLHPPTPLMLPHKAGAAVKLGGYDVPRGSIVLVNVWAIARDPAAWEDPLEFRPERFAGEGGADVKGNDFRVLPFGAGRRVCPGAQLGLNLVQSMVGHLLHQFRWAPPPGVGPAEMDMTEDPGLVTFMHTPLQAVATPRLEDAGLYKRVPVDM